MTATPGVAEPRGTLEHGGTLPPLGRPVPKGPGGLLGEILERVQDSWTAREKSAAYRRKVWIAGAIAVVGLILVFRMIILSPWALHAPAAKESGPVSVLSPEGPPGGGRMPPLASPTDPTASGVAAPDATHPLQAPSLAGRQADTLTRAAEQIERLSAFLKSTAAPDTPPVEPTGPQEVIPPIPNDEVPGPKASQEERAYYEDLLRRRERLALEVGDNLVRARGQGITMESAREVAAMLRSRAEALRQAPKEGAGTGTPSHWASPQSKLSVREIDQVILTLLGRKDGEEVLRIRDTR